MNGSRDPLVTVVMATYNSSRTLKLAIDSVLAQDFSNFEIRIVGDACTDDTEDVVGSFGDRRINWINLPINSGNQATPNNEGIRCARGEYIAYLGHDDLWFPWHLSSLVGHIREADADLVHPLLVLFSPSGLEKIVGPPPNGRTYADHSMAPSCWLHKREVTEELGPWGDHLKLMTGVDTDFFRRFHLSDKKISYYPRVSLIKFPSPMWRIYKKGNNQGQLEYSGKLKKDPEKLEMEILNQAAELLAYRTREKIGAGRAAKDLIYIILKNMIDFYGSERWPLKQILLRRFQRIRSKLNRKRGLTKD